MRAWGMNIPHAIHIYHMFTYAGKKKCQHLHVSTNISAQKFVLGSPWEAFPMIAKMFDKPFQNQGNMKMDQGVGGF